MPLGRYFVFLALLVCVQPTAVEADRDFLAPLKQQTLELEQQQRHSEAIEVAKTWVTVAVRKHGENSAQAAEALDRLGALHMAQGRRLREQAAGIRVRLGETELRTREGAAGSPADSDGNGLCDQADRELFEKRYGACAGLVAAQE